MICMWSLTFGKTPQERRTIHEECTGRIAECADAMYIEANSGPRRETFKLPLFPRRDIVNMAADVPVSTRYFRLIVKSLTPNSRYSFKSAYLGVDPVEDVVVRVVPPTETNGVRERRVLLDFVMPWTYVTDGNRTLRSAEGAVLSPLCCGANESSESSYLVEVSIISKRVMAANTGATEALVTINIAVQEHILGADTAFWGSMGLVVLSLLLTIAAFRGVMKHRLIDRCTTESESQGKRNQKIN